MPGQSAKVYSTSEAMFVTKERRLQAIPALMAWLREVARPVWPSELITETGPNVR
jgi:hypothetical protein